MKQKMLFLFLCMAMLCMNVACSDDDDDVVQSTGPDLDELLFTVNELAATTTTYTFSITPSSTKMSYLCLYVDKAVIDQVPKGELHSFLMKDLEKQAQSKGESFDSYLASISHVGNIKEMTIKNLLPGHLYELVMFGIRGTETAKQPTCHFFQTPKADFINCPFDVQVDASQVGSVKLDVTPGDLNTKWYFCSMEKRIYENARSQGMDDVSVISTYFTQQLNQMLGMMAPDGNVTPEVLDQALGQMLHQGSQSLKMGGMGFMADTDYVWLAIAIFVTPDYELLFISQPSSGEFHSKAVDKKDTTFEMKVDNIRQTAASIEIIPSNLQQKYVWRCDVHNPTTEKMSPEELAKYIVSTNPYIFFEARAHGKVSYPDRKLTPGTKHYMIAFGFEGGISTDVKRIDFEPAAPGDPAAINFEVKVLGKTSDEISLEVTPSDETVYYMPLLYPKGEDKESIKGRMMAGFNSMLYQTQQQLNPYATIWDIIAQSAYIGKESMTYSSVVSGEEYTLLILTFDKKGIHSERYFNESYVTIPGLSPATKVDGMKVAGVFSGDEENGSIFGQPDAVRGKAIVAMSYQCTPDVVKAFASVNADQTQVDELDPNQLPDKEILNANLNWGNMNVKHPYQFLVTDWDMANISYSFGINGKDERGPIARALIPACTPDKVQPISELKKLVDEANSKEEAAMFRLPDWGNWNAVHQDVDVKMYMGKCMGAQDEAAEFRVPMRLPEQAVKEVTPVIGQSFYLPVVNPVVK